MFHEANIGNVLINLPGDLPVPKTREAIEKALKAKEASSTAWAARDRALELKAKIESSIATEHGALLDANPDAKLPDGGKIIRKAQTLAEDSQRDLNARVEAERRAAMKIRPAILEERDDLARLALSDGDVALAMLGVVIDDAEAAREALHRSVGVANLAANLRKDDGAPLSIMHKAYGYTFSMAAAIEGLREAFERAHAELVALRADEKPARGKRAPKPKEAVTIDPDAIPAPLGADAPIFEVGTDDDDA